MTPGKVYGWLKVKNYHRKGLWMVESKKLPQERFMEDLKVKNDPRKGLWMVESKKLP